METEIRKTAIQRYIHGEKPKTIYYDSIVPRNGSLNGQNDTRASKKTSIRIKKIARKLHAK